MKKFLLVLFAAVLCTGCATQSSIIDSNKRANLEAYKLLKDREHNIQVSSFKEVFNMIGKKQSGVFYIGYSECAWCKEAVPVLNEVAKETKKAIHYIELYDENGEITFQKEDYSEFVELAKDKLDKNEENKPTLYVPYVFVIEEGKIKDSHIATVEDHDATVRKMTDKQRESLKKIYYKMLNK